MADIRIAPSTGVIQFSGSSSEIAFIKAATGEFTNQFTISSSGDLNLKADSNIIASGSFILSSSVSTSPFIIVLDNLGGDHEKFKINAEGVTVLGAAQSEPTAVEGGIYYKNGVFYIGDDN